MEVPDCLEGEEFLIISHDAPVAARCETSQLQLSFLAAFPVLKGGEWVDMDRTVRVHIGTLSGDQFNGFRSAPAVFTSIEQGSWLECGGAVLCAR